MTFYDPKQRQPKRRVEKNNHSAYVGVGMLVVEFLFIQVMKHRIPDTVDVDLLAIIGLAWAATAFAAIFYNF